MAPPTAQQIARELVHPTKQWHVIHIGDSRGVSLGRDMVQHATEIAWSGCGPISANAASQDAFATGYAEVIATGGLPVENAHLEGDSVNVWAVINYWSAVFTGEDAPASLGAQLCYGSFDRATFPLVYDRLIAGGGAAKVRAFYRKNSIGIVGGDGVRLGLATGAGYYDHPLDPPCYVSDPITDTTGAGSLAVAEVSMPPRAGSRPAIAPVSEAKSPALLMACVAKNWLKVPPKMPPPIATFPYAPGLAVKNALRALL